jgi:hypothetical protein
MNCGLRVPLLVVDSGHVQFGQIRSATDTDERRKESDSISQSGTSPSLTMDGVHFKGIHVNLTL